MPVQTKRTLIVASVLLSGALAATSGCGQRAEKVAAIPAPPVTPSAITVQIANADGYRKQLEELRGNVVLVDFWATWCGPCLAQFPHTVELYEKYHEQGLAVVSVSLDDPSAQPQVLSFLQRHQATFANLLSEYGGSTEAMDDFQLSGAVPCYRIYDRSGQLLREFAVDPFAERQFTTEDVEAAVRELL